MRIEVTVKATQSDGYSLKTLAEASRIQVVDDGDHRAARRLTADMASDAVDAVEGRLRHLARVEAEKADE